MLLMLVINELIPYMGLSARKKKNLTAKKED